MIVDGLSYDAKNKKWNAKYPFIKDPNKLPNNRDAVLSNLHSTERRLNRNPILAKTYREQIKDMVQRGACRKLSQS